MSNLKLLVVDTGDFSMGIYSKKWLLDTPFVKEDIVEKREDMERFKEGIYNTYLMFSEGYLTADYIDSPHP